jgi:hypothetical protein
MSIVVLLIVQFIASIFPSDRDVELIGVYQGTSLFIQNPYQAHREDFCIESIYVNNRRLDINYDLSAIILDFNNHDLYTPVAIRIVAKDSLCAPVILNPDAILFHTMFKFTTINLSDSTLAWETEGERGSGKYIVEKLIDNFWHEVEQLQASGTFEEASYEVEPTLGEGANKYRVKYEFGSGRYLYSQEVDFDYYPDPVQFSPYRTYSTLTLSRFSPYEIYDEKSQLVLSGSGKTIDVRSLPLGEYVIFFDGKDPGSFTRIRK